MLGETAQDTHRLINGLGAVINPGQDVAVQINHSDHPFRGEQAFRERTQRFWRRFRLRQERQRHQRITREEVECNRTVTGVFLDDRQDPLGGQCQVFSQGTAFAHGCCVLQHSLPESDRTDRGAFR